MALFGLFGNPKKSDEPPKDVKRIFEKMKREMEGQRLANDAISYRNLGNYDKAFELLKKALDEFDYTPAINLIGTTTLLKGDVPAAIQWFTVQIEHIRKRGEFPLIELYANLGSIYGYVDHFRDNDKALEMYHKALDAPRPPIYGEQDYAMMVSNVHGDMAGVYGNTGDLGRARQYALRCLAVNPESEIAKAVVAKIDE